MCRIVGIVDPYNQALQPDVLRMRDAMHRGGPDSAGVFVDENNHMALGHRRLSIIDLTADGHQPMLSNDEQLVLVFNGEIYNYLELKSELRNRGHQFKSHSDTEVVLVAYQEWGVDCFARFKGMFAIAIYDQRSKELILARDHAGIKPLYIYRNGLSLYFASEVRAFAALQGRFEEDPHWRTHFLTYGFLPAPFSTLKNVRSLQRGTYLQFNCKTGKIISEVFYADDFTEELTNEKEAVEKVREVLDKAVQRHLLADAPLGVFLSGGIDSSLITILAKKHKPQLQTLSITFGEKAFDEEQYQQLIVQQFHTQHTAYRVDESLFRDALPDVLEAMDQPTTDGINSYFISRFAREAGLKAVLSGLGADELFGGYPSFNRRHLIRKLQRLPNPVLQASAWLPKNKLRRISLLGNKKLPSEYLFNRGYHTPAETARLLQMNEREVINILEPGLELASEYAQWDSGNRTSYLESQLYMQSQLLKDTDSMSMWHGLEVRVPFLDLDLMRLAHRIAPAVKFDRAYDKYLLIEAFKNELPRAVWDRKKQGFAFPFSVWMKDSLDGFVKTSQDRQVKDRFEKGVISWSRYWAYLLSKSFSFS